MMPFRLDKTIKLWRVDEGAGGKNNDVRKESSTYLAERGLDTPPPPPKHLGSIFSRTPKPQEQETKLRLPSARKHANPSPTAKPRKTFENAHAYHINSLSLSSDGETFLSSDDLRINLWNIECMTHAFSESLLRLVTADADLLAGATQTWWT
jgi:serine/threonine-protein phosphatase 2A regulatory subunit B